MIHPLIKEELDKLDKDISEIAETALLAANAGTEQEIIAAIEKKLQQLFKNEVSA